MAGEITLPLTETQRKRLETAANVEELRRAYVDISLELAEQQIVGLGLENEWDESGVQVRSDALPLDQEVSIRFPGVDPRGHYSPLDMRIAERMDRIDSTLALRGEAANDVIPTLMASRLYTGLERQVQELAREQRKYMRAERICALLAADSSIVISGDEAVAKANKQAASTVALRNLRQPVQESEGNQATLDMDKMVKSMEYLLGIQTGALPRDVREFCRQHGIDVSPATLETCRKVTIPEKVEIKHSYFLNREVQFQAAKPENWGRNPTEFAQLTPDEINQLVTPYLRATEGRTLNAMFGGVERTTEYREDDVTLYAMDRGDYLIIGGKTVKEHLREMFEAGLFTDPDYRDQDFNYFYGKEGHQRVAEYVGAALTRGERVEAFIPNELGQLSARPVSLKASGFEAARLDPVTLNAWERFWSYFGFYKQKVAQAAEQASFEKAYERVRIRHEDAQVRIWDSGTSQRVENEFFGDWKAEHFKTAPEPARPTRPYHFSRSAWTTLATLKMLGDGYELADVLDPAKLREEKQEAGRELIEEIMGDPAKEKELFVKGAARYLEQIDKMAEQFDLTKPETFTSPEFRPLLRGFYVGYDAFQELGLLQNEFTEAEAAQFREMSATLKQFGALGVAVEGLYAAKKSITTMEPIGAGFRRDFYDYLYATAAIQKVGTRAAELAGTKPDGKVRLSEVVTKELGAELMALKGNLAASSEPEALGTMLTQDPKRAPELRDAIRTDSFLRTAKVKDGRDGVPEFTFPKAFQPKPEKSAQKARL